MLYYPLYLSSKPHALGQFYSLPTNRPQHLMDLEMSLYKIANSFSNIHRKTRRYYTFHAFRFWVSESFSLQCYKEKPERKIKVIVRWNLRQNRWKISLYQIVYLQYVQTFDPRYVWLQYLLLTRTIYIPSIHSRFLSGSILHEYANIKIENHLLLDCYEHLIMLCSEY